jgi:hypothetical protein
LQLYKNISGRVGSWSWSVTMSMTRLPSPRPMWEIAMDAGGSAVATGPAHIALMREDWLLVPAVLRIVRRTMGVVKSGGPESRDQERTPVR